MSNRAVVLAGGKGTRLRPYTMVFPKPLMPIGEYPILEVIVRQLAKYGFDRITLSVNHQAELIRTFFGDGGKWKVRIDYSMESEPLSTIAPLKLISDLPENFLLMNGDVLTDLNFDRLLAGHAAQGRMFTIASTRRDHLVDYGVLGVDERSRLSSFTEKPVLQNLVSMGVYAVNRDVLNFVPSGVKYGFDNLMLDMIARGQEVHVEQCCNYWLDIGRVDDYRQAIEEFDQKRERFFPNGH